ncbi:GNAT family N-acetyltransferase [Listeria sp. PSOL-1]|uniref:GNAT family N-acetyltransferase n=1 Tax=Listeria sp. PSOL-1 TaxID=1844999 RepID=UPI0013D15403|nr:GNAT family protein [Listeria sp. PSOL-1]
MATNFFTYIPSEFKTVRTILKETVLQDAASLYTIWTDASVSRFMNIEYFMTMKQAKDMIETISKEKFACRYSIFYQNQLIGSVGINDVDQKSSSCEIGYELSEKYWRQGIMSEVLYHFLSLIEKWLSFEEVTAKVLPDNIASISLLKKMGFELKESIQEFDLHSHNFHNVYIYKITLNSNKRPS